MIEPKKETTNWDIYNLGKNHQSQFLIKLKHQNTKIQKKKTKKNRIVLPIAASFILSASIITMAVFHYKTTKSVPEVVLSANSKQTTDYFASIIQTNLTQLKEKQTPENKKIVEDAFLQILKLEQDYQKLEQEIYKHGENKQLLYALVTNLQTRINFLEKVIRQIEILNPSNANHYENIL